MLALGTRRSQVIKAALMWVTAPTLQRGIRFHTATATSTLPHFHTATLPTGQQLASISLRLHLRHSLYWSWCKCNANLAKYPQKFAQLCARGSVLHCNFSQSVWSISRARVVCSCHKKLHAVRRNYAKGSVCIVFPT